jgi:hypothetical protein
LKWHIDAVRKAKQVHYLNVARNSGRSHSPVVSLWQPEFAVCESICTGSSITGCLNRCDRIVAAESSTSRHARHNGLPGSQHDEKHPCILLSPSSDGNAGIATGAAVTGREEGHVTNSVDICGSIVGRCVSGSATARLRLTGCWCEYRAAFFRRRRRTSTLITGNADTREPLAEEKSRPYARCPSCTCA